MHTEQKEKSRLTRPRVDNLSLLYERGQEHLVEGTEVSTKVEAEYICEMECNYYLRVLFCENKKRSRGKMRRTRVRKS